MLWPRVNLHFVGRVHSFNFLPLIASVLHFFFVAVTDSFLWQMSSFVVAAALVGVAAADTYTWAGPTLNFNTASAWAGGELHRSRCCQHSMCCSDIATIPDYCPFVSYRLWNR